MMLSRLFLAASLALASIAHVSAFDRVLPAPRIKDNGDIRLSDDVKIGRFQGNKYIATPDSIAIGGAGSTGPIGGMSALLPGASTALTLAQHLSRLPLPVSIYGAIGDGVADDAPAINATVQAACARGGAEVLLMKQHKLGAAIDNNCDGVFVRGIGAEDTPHDSGSGFAGTLIFPAPGYTGDGLVHRTRTATEKGIAPAANRIVTGGGFTGITAFRFRRNLHVTSTRRGTYKLALLDATGSESGLFDTLPDYRNGTSSQVGEASDTQGMVLDIAFRQYDNGTSGVASQDADGIVFTSTGGGNISYNFNMRLNGQVHNGLGWKVISGDNNVWDNFRVVATGTGKPFRIQANTATGPNDSNVFNHYYSNAVGYVEGPADRANSTAPVQTTINVLDTSNSSAVPVAGAGSSLVIVNGARGWSNWTPTFSPASGSYTSTVLVEARYRRLALDNTVSFTVTFAPTYTTASGAAQFTLPFPSVSNVIFTGKNASTGKSMNCQASQGSSLVSCLQFDSASPLVNGNFYGVSGSYEAQ